MSLSLLWLDHPWEPNACQLLFNTALGAVSVTDIESRNIAVDVAAAKALGGGSLQRAVILISSLLPSIQETLLRVCRVLCSTSSQLTIGCTLSEAAHCDELNYEAEDNVPYYERFAMSLSHQVQRPSCKIVIKHCPLPAIFIGENAFVLASLSSIDRVCGFHRPSFGGQSRTPTTLHDDCPVEQDDRVQHGTGIASLAHTIAQVAASLNVRSTSAFCLGPESVAIGKALSFVPPVTNSLGTGTSPKQAAFVIVDRALDMVSPLLHRPLLLQQVFQVLHENNEENSNDIGLSHQAAPLTQALLLEDSGFLASSIFHPTDPHASANLSFLLSRSGQDAALFLRKWLREAARKEGIQAQQLKRPQKRSTAGSSIAEELKTLISSLKMHYKLQASNQAIWDNALIQLAEAMAKTLDASESALLMAKAERALLLACTEGDVDGSLYQLMDLFAATHKSAENNTGFTSISMSFAFGMLLLCYQILPAHIPWFAGDLGHDNALTDGRSPFSPEQEIQLQEAITNSIIQSAKRWAGSDEPQEQAKREAPWLSASLRSDLLIESNATCEEGQNQISKSLLLELRDAIETIINTAKIMSQSRSELLMSKESSDETPTPLLVRLIDMIMGEKGTVKGLVHASTSLAGLLKSGLGRIGLQRQPRPKDYELIVLFVVGGISLSEMHDVLARVDELQVNSESDSLLPRVVVGGSFLVVPSTVPRMAFGAC